jgi:hypothetical protein
VLLAPPPRPARAGAPLRPGRTAAPVPRLPEELEGEFGRRLLPFKGYGRDGFAGSVTYVF